MRSTFFLFLTLSLFTACNNSQPSGNDAILSATPYAAVNDSIKNNPSNPELYYSRGQQLYKNEQDALAEADIRKAWTLAPKEEYALSLVTILGQKSPDAALIFLREASAKLPGSIALQVGLARALQAKGQRAEALAACNNIIRNYPGQIDALILKAELLKEEGKTAESLSVAEQAYALAPEDPELAQNLAFSYAEAKNPKCLTLADSLIKADVEQRHAEPYYIKGVYYANLNQPTEAIRFFDEAIRHDYNFYDAHMEKGRILFNTKKYKEAQQTFTLVTRISPSFADAWYWIGECQMALGQPKEAKLNYQRAYGLDKSNTAAKEKSENIRG